MEKTEMKVWVTKAVGERILERRDLQKRNPEYLPKKKNHFPSLGESCLHVHRERLWKA